MTLEARTRPYREEIESNARQMLELAEWIMQNPDAHEDLRREKFAAWRKLERENEALERMWDESRESWLKARLNRSAEISEIVGAVVRTVAGDFE